MESENNWEKIDIHKAAETLQVELEKLRKDPSISKANRAIIQRFLSDCRIGKTVLKKQKKKIGEKRLLKYLYVLPRISFWLGQKDFRKITEKEMEQFISLLEENKLTIPKKGATELVSFSEWTKRDFKVCLKKFYKWLLGNGKSYPRLVSWIDTSVVENPPPSLSLDQIKHCVDYALLIRGKALFWTLFETGARAEEFLNIRVSHVEDKGTRFVVRIEYPKTYKRSLPVYEGAHYLREWLKIHPKKNEPDSQLFPVSYGGLHAFLKRLGKRALGTRIYPQLVRHSFATRLASEKIGRYQMCKVMGWAMSSDMPDKYIDRTGVVEEEAIQAIRGDQLTTVEKENEELKMALKRLEAQSNELQEKMVQREKMDTFLTVLLKDKSLRAILVDKIKEKDLGKTLLNL